MTAFVYATLAVWFVLTLIKQLHACPWRPIRALANAIHRHDALRLIPSYSYFAPRPPTLDFELLYRDRLDDGTVTPWRAMTLASSALRRAVWNPEKRRYEVVFDLCSALIQEARREMGSSDRRGDIYVSRAYVGLTHSV